MEVQLGRLQVPKGSLRSPELDNPKYRLRLAAPIHRPALVAVAMDRPLLGRRSDPRFLGRPPLVMGLPEKVFLRLRMGYTAPLVRPAMAGDRHH